MDIQIGNIVNNPGLDWQPTVVCGNPSLAAHCRRPWFQAWVAERVGLPLAETDGRDEGGALIPDTLCARHGLIVGSTGSGKTRLIQHITGQVMMLGHSVVALDPKLSTLLHHASLAYKAGLAPEQVTILSPRLETGLPGFNPLNAGVPINQAASDFVSLLDISSAAAPRMLDLVTNGLILIGAHGLSVFELIHLLTSDSYAYTLIQKTPSGMHGLDQESYLQVCEFFTNEFMRWSPSERTQAVAPVLRRLRELLRNPCLRGLLCARRNTLDLPSLWRNQQVVLIHLDHAVLGDNAARLLAGLLVIGLFRTALRNQGKRPVQLVIDESATAEKFVGGVLQDILTVARSLNLRVLLACQFLSGLSDSLRAALVSQAAVQMYFRLGATDAKSVASAITPGTPDKLQRLVAEASDDTAMWRHVIRDNSGRPLRVSRGAWDRIRWDGYYSAAPLRDLERVASCVGTGRLYVKDPISGQAAALGHYLKGLKPLDYWFDGPQPLSLIVAFPKPKISGVERWSEHDAAQAWMRVLMDLAVRHCVLRLAGQQAKVVRVANVPGIASSDGLRRFLDAVVRVSGQSLQERSDVLHWRRRQIEELLGGIGYREEVDDGSIA